MSSLRRKAALTAALLISGLAPLGVTSSADATPPTQYKTSTVTDGGTRTAPTGDDTSPVKVFQIRFTAEEGERRYVTSQVLAQQGDTPDPLLMASVSITCAGTGSQSVSATQNTQRNQTTTLTPRFVFVAEQAGEVSCTLYVHGGRPDPAASSPSSANTWSVDTGSYLAVSSPMPWWTRTFDNSDLTSRVLKNPGDTWTTINKTFTIGADVTSFDVVSDHKVTVCSSKGGSQDGTTGGNDLCVGDLVVPGGSSVVGLVVKIRQRDGSSWCGDAQTLVDRTTTVTRNLHHVMIPTKASVDVDPACSPSFTLTTQLRLVSGTATMVHAPNEKTMITS